MPLNYRPFLFAVSLALTFAAHAANVTGTVTDAATNRPLGSMVVAAYDTAGALRATATTDATGLYVLTVAPGEYRLLAYDPAGVYATMFDGNAESFETSPVRSIGAGGATVDFALVRGGMITGNVRPGAIVEAFNLSGTRRGFTTADANGVFTLVLPPGEYKLVAYDPEGIFAPSFHRDARAFAEATPVRVTEGLTTGNILFTLRRAARVSGTAVDAATQAPLSGMLVYAYTSDGLLVAQTVTAGDGSFAFSLAPGPYRFVAADPARVYATVFHGGSRSFELAEIVTLVEAEQRTGVALALVRGVVISGHVSAAGVTVSAYNLDGTLHVSTTSDAGGNYALLVAPGDYKVVVADPGLVYATQFYGGTTFRTAARLSASTNVSGIDLTLVRAGRISGIVRNAENGQPLAGIQVAAYDSDGVAAAVATTGADGRYALAVAPGAYRLLAFDVQLTYVTAYAGGQTSYETTVPLVITADSNTTVDFVMRRGLRVTGQVASRNGTGLTGIEIFALDADGNRVAAATSNGGAFTIVLPPGTYRFVAVDPEGRFFTAEYPGSVIVSEGHLPPPVIFSLDGRAGRRRSVRH